MSDSRKPGEWDCSDLGCYIDQLPLKEEGANRGEAVAEPSREQEKENEMLNPIMKYFEYAHLPEKLQSVSKPIGELAGEMNGRIPDGPEKSAGLRKLLEAKDCFVRAAL